MARARAFLIVAALLLAMPLSAQSASGDFQFALAGSSGAVQFNARMHGSSARGDLTFTANVEVSGDSDDDGGQAPSAMTATLSVSIDCLRQTGNRAAMSGIVTSSNVPAFVGRRAILAVEDNGEGVNASRDAFTWGLYNDDAPSWTPSDAEVPGDAGATFSWIATDSERPDDTGVPAGANAPDGLNCQSFGLGAYSLEILGHGNGNIQVRP